MTDTTDGIGRRTFVRWAGGVIGAAAIGAGAFGTRGLVPHTSGAGPKDLTMSWWAEGTLSKLHVDVVKRYESMHRGVSVQAQYQPLNGYDDKLSTEMSGGNQPDVFMLRRATFAEYISRGAVRQLDDLVPGTLPFDSLPASLRAAAQYKGHWYAIPLGLASSPALIGNETLFGSVGIATPGTDWATEDFESVMRQVVKGTGGRVYGSNDMCGNEYALTSFLAGKKKPLFDADGQPGFDHDDLGTWLERWEKYRTDGLVAPMKITSATTGFTTDPLVVGKAAITLAASSKGINGYQPLVKDTLTLLAYPREDASAPTATTVGPIEWFALSSRIDAAKAQQAAELAMAFVDDQWALRTLNLAHGVPLFASTRKALYPSQSAGNKAIYDNVQAIEDAGPAPVPTYPPGAEDFLGQLGTQNQLVGFGKTSISKAVDAVFADARRTLA